jgi:hypothetical protein
LEAKMTISSVNNRPLQPVRRPAPAPANTPAPVAKAKAQAPAAPAAKPQHFSDVESYKDFVAGSDVTKLPAARAAVEQAKARSQAAGEALAARKRELNHAALQAALDDAERKLDAASFPKKPDAAKKKAEAEATAQQVGQIDGQIAQLQQRIGQAQASKAARNRDAWWGDHSNDTWVDVVIDAGGALADGSTISSANKQIQQLIAQKTTLQQKALSLTMEATALENQPGDPAQIAAAKKVRDDAKAALDAAFTAELPQQQACDAAAAALGKAQGELTSLEGLKKQLQDYNQEFGFFTRMSLMFHNFHWKRDLDAYWKQKGL